MIEFLVSLFGIWFVGALAYTILKTCSVYEGYSFTEAASLAVLWPVWAVKSIIVNARHKWNEDTK